jgi:hypothetical protein
MEKYIDMTNPDYYEYMTNKNETFPSGAVRSKRDGRGRFDLIPGRALERLAKHFETGAKAKGEGNWERGIPLSRYLDGAIRHLNDAKIGRDNEDHLVAAAWNIFCLMDTQERIKDYLMPEALDDLTGSVWLSSHGSAIYDGTERV